MAKSRTSFWIVPPLSACLVAVCALGPSCEMAWGQQSSNKSWMDSVSSGVKSGFSKVGNALNPPKNPAAKRPTVDDDAISLKSKSKPSPELYVAVARLYEEAGRPDEAEWQYRAALEQWPNYLPALLGYARLKEATGQPDEALRLYQRAVKAHPREPAVYNNMALCHARMGRKDEAIAILGRAIELAPRNPRYRNNIAALLVDQGRLREAFDHFRQALGDAAAYYNVAFLLQRKGQTQAAIEHFSLALRADPSMAPAQRWLDYLQRTAARQRLGEHPAAAGVKITSRRDRAVLRMPTLTAPATPHRLPPVPTTEPNDGPALPGIAYRPSTPPSAPMPPPSRNPAVQPLPRTR